MDGHKYVLEVGVSNVADAERAWRQGADRLELSMALEIGGLTPSQALIEQAVRATPLPLIVLIRPRPAGFCYDEHEFTTMLRDIEGALERGAAGVAVGALTRAGTPDRRRCAQLRKQTMGRECVFHRAFDVSLRGASDHVTPRSRAARNLQILIDEGMDRVLTSGGAHTAREGAAMLWGLQRLAGEQIDILPAAGIRAENVTHLLERTGCRGVHGTFRKRCRDAADPVAGGDFTQLDPAQVARMRRILDARLEKIRP